MVYLEHNAQAMVQTDKITAHDWPR